MKVFVVMLVAIIFMGCNRRSAAIIPANKMTSVMWDVIQADEYATGYLSKDSSRNITNERMNMYRQIFSLHHITEDDYFASFKYYSGQPGLFKVMIDSLSQKANSEQRNSHIPVKAVSK